MNEEIKISILLENHSCSAQLSSEHGLSMLIKTPSTQLIFDTGQSDLFAQNATNMGEDLSATQHLVFSHGHYDHTGGLPALSQDLPNIKIWGHESITLKRYSIKDAEHPREIGIPQASLKTLDHYNLNLTNHPTEIADEIYATGYIPRNTDFEDTGGPFFLDPKQNIPDEINDDQALYFQTSRGLVILLGCAHAGIINTIHYCQKLTGEKRLHALIGGFHLVNAGSDRISKTIEILKKLSPGILGACHCTGEGASATLKEHFPDTFRNFSAGTEIIFDRQR